MSIAMFISVQNMFISCMHVGEDSFPSNNHFYQQFSNSIIYTLKAQTHRSYVQTYKALVYHTIRCNCSNLFRQICSKNRGIVFMDSSWQSITKSNGTSLLYPIYVSTSLILMIYDKYVTICNGKSDGKRANNHSSLTEIEMSGIISWSRLFPRGVELVHLLMAFAVEWEHQLIRNSHKDCLCDTDVKE